MYKILLKEIDLKPQWKFSRHKSQTFLRVFCHRGYWYWAAEDFHITVLPFHVTLWHSLFSASRCFLPTPTLWCGESFCLHASSIFPSKWQIRDALFFGFFPQSMEKYSASGFGFFHTEKYKIYCIVWPEQEGLGNLCTVLGWHFSMYCSTLFLLFNRWKMLCLTQLPLKLNLTQVHIKLVQN